MAVKATTGSIAVHFVPQLTPVRTTRVMKSAVGHRKVIKVVSPDHPSGLTLHSDPYGGGRCC